MIIKHPKKKKKKKSNFLFSDFVLLLICYIWMLTVYKNAKSIYVAICYGFPHGLTECLITEKDNRQLHWRKLWMFKCFHSRKRWSNSLVICNLSHPSPGKGVGYSVGKVRGNTFSMTSTGAVISLKSRVFAVALLDKAMPLSLNHSANVMIPGKGGCCYKWLFMLFEKYIYSLGLTRKHTTQVKAGWLNRRFV